MYVLTCWPREVVVPTDLRGTALMVTYCGVTRVADLPDPEAKPCAQCVRAYALEVLAR